MSTTTYDARSPLASPLLPKGEASTKGEDSLTQLLETLRERYRRRTHTTSTVGINWRSRKFFGQLEQFTWRLG